jgi:hypothetical protein
MNFKIVSVISLAIFGLTSTDTLAECGNENKSISVKNFEAEAIKSCNENPNYPFLEIRPYVPAIGNFAKTSITCSRIFNVGRKITLSADKNPKLSNSIQVLGDLFPNTIQVGEIELKDMTINYRINFLKE